MGNALVYVCMCVYWCICVCGYPPDVAPRCRPFHVHFSIFLYNFCGQFPRHPQFDGTESEWKMIT